MANCLPSKQRIWVRFPLSARAKQAMVTLRESFSARSARLVVCKNWYANWNYPCWKAFQLSRRRAMGRKKQHRAVYLVRVPIYCFALALGANLLLCTCSATQGKPLRDCFACNRGQNLLLMRWLAKYMAVRLLIRVKKPECSAVGSASVLGTCDVKTKQWNVDGKPQDVTSILVQLNMRL